jgi:hypothetical protein
MAPRKEFAGRDFTSGDHPHFSGSLPRKGVEATTGLDEANGYCGVEAFVNERLAVHPNLVDSVADCLGDSPAMPNARQVIYQVNCPDAALRFAPQKSFAHSAREAIEFKARMIVSSESGTGSASITECITPGLSWNVYEWGQIRSSVSA